jgi:peroxiredoxin
MKQNLYFALLLIIPIIIAITFREPSLNVGDKAPAFTLSRLNGGTASLHDFKGKITVVHLWSHTCPHCRSMNQTLPEEVRPYLNSTIAYLMISIDEDTSGLRKVIQEDKLDFAIHLLDPHDVKSKTMIEYNAKGTPCLNIVDEQGKILALNISEDQFEKYLTKKKGTKK